MTKTTFSKTAAAILLLAFVLIGNGCAMKTMGSTEIGVVVKELPKFLGGGIQKEILKSGEMTIYCFLWTSVYELDTRVFSRSYAGAGTGDNPLVNDAANTRANDGNEIWLSYTNQFKIIPEKAEDILRYIGEEFDRKDNVETVVDKATGYKAYERKNGPGSINQVFEAYSRSKIRLTLGEINTANFYDNKLRYEKTDLAKWIINQEVERFGLTVVNLNLDKHEFDTEYQGKINDTKQWEEKAEGQARAIDAMRAQKSAELQKTIGTVNKQIADADGYVEQTKNSADTYFITKENEAMAILKEGENEVTAIKNNIAALNRPGGHKMVRMKIAESIVKSGAPFFVVDQGGKGGTGGGGSLNLNTFDVNQVLNAFGAMSLSGQNALPSRDSFTHRK